MTTTETEDVISPESILRANGSAEIDWTDGGSTKHFQVFKLATIGARFGLPPETVARVAVEFIEANAGRVVARDIEHQIQSAYRWRSDWDSGRIDCSRLVRRDDGSLGFYGNVLFSREKLQERVRDFPGDVSDALLRNLSAEPFPTNIREFLAGLFLEGEKVFITDHPNARVPMSLPNGIPDRITRDKGVWFLINPIDGEWHVHERFKSKFNPEGKSQRCKEALTAWRHLLLESDVEGEGFLHEWVKFIMTLRIPVRAIYSSGGKSVHALIGVHAQTEAEWLDKVGPLKSEFVLCGADPAAIRGVQLSRLPFCVRREKVKTDPAGRVSGGQQKLLYWRPDADDTPIIDLL